MSNIIHKRIVYIFREYSPGLSLIINSPRELFADIRNHTVTQRGVLYPTEYEERIVKMMKGVPYKIIDKPTIIQKVNKHLDEFIDEYISNKLARDSEISIIFDDSTSVNTDSSTSITEECISSILNVPLEKFNPSDTVIFIDWDRTISSGEGRHDFREGISTKKFINKVIHLKLGLSVITARGGNLSISRTNPEYPELFGKSAKDFFRDMTKDMTKLLGGDVFINNGALRLEKSKIKEINILSKSVILLNQVIYTGTVSKSSAIELLISNNFLKNKSIKNVVFIDNDIRHTSGVKKMFKNNNKYNLEIYHYPLLDPNDGYPADEKC